MKKLLLVPVFCFTLVAQIQAQNITASCTQILRTARGTYDQGRLHELPALLEGCLKNGFTTIEKIEAYKILTLTYIYLEEPEKADNAMIKLLQTDHFFEVNDALDPVEFKALYKKFRTNPLFRIGVKVGLNTTQVNTLKNYYVFANGQGKGTYASNLGLQFGAFFEKDLKHGFIINPEIFYSSNSFSYSNSTPFEVDSVQKEISQTATIKQSHAQLNLLVQYTIGKKNKLGKSKLTPYVAIGPSVSYLLSSSFEGNTNIETEEDVTGTAIQNKKSYNPITYSVIAAGGVKYKVGGLYLTADLRYQYSFSNSVDGSQRYRSTPENIEMIYRYGYIDNDFSLNHAMFNIGLIYPYFSPKKLIK